MKKIIVVFSLFLVLSETFGQASHYWTESYGTRSMLLNGVVIGSVEDLGAVYYNPARLSQFESPAFVISGQVYQLEGLKLENGLGDGIDLERSQFGSGPSLVSGTFKVGFLEGHQFAYAFLTRVKSENNFSFAVETEGDYVSRFPGDEYFSGQITSNNTVRDEWMGLSWSYPLNEKISIGATGFYSNLERNAGLRTQEQAYSVDSGTVIRIQKRSYGFKSQSILGKFGISYKGKKLTAGLTVTTPKLEGITSGNTSYETFLSGIDTTANDDLTDVYVINNQGNLETQHNTPWSVGVGAGFRLGKRSLLHTSVEWFSAIPSYTILKSQPFTGQSTQEVYQMTIVDKLGSVINYGLGLEVYASEYLSIFGSFAMDYSAVNTEPDPISDFGLTVSNTSLRADRMHFGFGADISTKFADLTIGAMYAYSRENMERSFTIEDQSNPAVTEDITAIYSRWRFLIGFEFHYEDELRKKIENKFGKK